VNKSEHFCVFFLFQRLKIFYFFCYSGPIWNTKTWKIWNCFPNIFNFWNFVCGYAAKNSTKNIILPQILSKKSLSLEPTNSFWPFYTPKNDFFREFGNVLVFQIVFHRTNSFYPRQLRKLQFLVIFQNLFLHKAKSINVTLLYTRVLYRYLFTVTIWPWGGGGIKFAE
jgi:hypothetical protein